MTPKPTIGSISEGTTSLRDLIPCFARELERLSCFDQQKRLIQRAHETDPESYMAPEIVHDLISALNIYSLSYTFFGPNPDDGAAFGFWPDLEGLEDYVREGTVIKVNDLSEILSGDFRDVMLVNDHGNVTFGVWEHHATSNLMQFREVWSCV